MNFQEQELTNAIISTFKSVEQKKQKQGQYTEWNEVFVRQSFDRKVERKIENYFKL